MRCRSGVIAVLLDQRGHLPALIKVRLRQPSFLVGTHHRFSGLVQRKFLLSFAIRPANLETRAECFPERQDARTKFHAASARGAPPYDEVTNSGLDMAHWPIQ
jgi:hypothetical protein